MTKATLTTMRLFIATLSTETNTFSTMPTGMSGFKEYFLRHGTATQEPPNLMTEALHVWRARAEHLGWDVIESLAAISEPAGPTTSACYEAFREDILSDLRKTGGVDIVLLQLHGAMVAEGIDDCEGDLLKRIRAICPDAVVGTALDQHCHLTQEMMQNCDLIVCFKEYPHDDASDRAEELFELAHRTVRGDIRPFMRAFDCRMVNLYLTKTGKMRDFVGYMRELETRPDILSVSLAHGFPWADVADVGAKTLVVTDNNPALALHTAETLGRRFFDLRHEVTSTYSTLYDAVEEAANSGDGPVVLADMGDNSGGGAPGDSTFMLHALLRRPLTNVATGIYWDPGAARICEDAGCGASIRLRLGGKTSLESGTPVDLDVRVMNIRTGIGQHLGKGLEPLGTLVWLRTGDEVDILINDLRTQVYHPEAFEQLGIELATKSTIVVKSLFHFYAPFEKIASRIIQVATPGGTSPDFKTLRLSKRQVPFWPRVDNPFKGEVPRDLSAPTQAIGA
ncbi:M81 family metallopeptidase [uncultured Roseibium sp.]|uniref:M81 family metallopeptidase n=1 Tax=uncultured Roseibium sp. TaxID=1936171 RepID=UPI002601B44E|nr:M81 family metallopeptidase [uncultured Roseibium sp.]